MKLPTVGAFSIEPYRCCCGQRGLLSARTRKLIYSFCYAVGFYSSQDLIKIQKRNY